MIKFITISVSVVMSVISLSAQITVNILDRDVDSVYVRHTLLSDFRKPAAERRVFVDTICPVDKTFKIDLDTEGFARYLMVLKGMRNLVDLYCEPGDRLIVDITSESPIGYTVTGSSLMEGICEIKASEAKLREKERIANELILATSDEDDKMNVWKKFKAEYNGFFKDYVFNNPYNPAAIYAICKLDGEDFLEAYDFLNESMLSDSSLKSSPLFPEIELKKAYVEKKLLAEKRTAELESGIMEAPDFTLLDINGNRVSLSDFRGKWTVIDFWGSWCGFCIQGIPELKEVYEKYASLLEILGVDCNETEERWRQCVERYELPWVNVYNPEDTSVLSDYGVMGFPTKIVVNPDGIIKLVKVGENDNGPRFIEELDRLITGK